MQPDPIALKELLLQSTAKLYFAENQLVRALKMMADKATFPELKDAFLTHRDETRMHVKRLAAIFPELQEVPQAHYCQAIEGLLQNGIWLMHTLERGPVLDSALIGAAQQVELFEVASYRNVLSLAHSLTISGMVTVFERTLHEELQADDILSSIATKLGMDSGVSLAVQEEEEEQKGGEKGSTSATH